MGKLPIDAGGEAKFTEKLSPCGYQAMNLRVGLPKIRVLSAETRLRSLAEGADQAEVLAGRVRSRVQPILEQLFVLRTRLATVAVGLLAIWLFLHVTFGANGMVIYRAKRAEYQKLQKDIDGLQKENAQYAQEVEELKTDPKRIEKEAREQFHYARPGEVIYVSPQRQPPLPSSNRTAQK